ncbi:hypothetical protein [Acidisoma cladoniae]|jgi:hypothetical protein|uniref:hypothetical protein n=1 Tax=Acidisoma cladoniae TaxID=3040935 RepID=UPI00254C5E4D|nr:hypothetical protein [Acidisoma sp. PAMC 29798]
MMRFGTLMGACALTLLAGCALENRLPDTAMMPSGSLGTNGDVDVRSLQVAAYSFGHYDEMMGNPAMAANAVAAVDYMGGKLNTSPRWTNMPGLWRAQILQSREILRDVVGISPTAPSQAVVDDMLALGKAYQAGDQGAVNQLLASPIFAVPPAEVARRLANIPELPVVNNATTHAAQFEFDFTTVSG